MQSRETAKEGMPQLQCRAFPDTMHYLQCFFWALTVGVSGSVGLARGVRAVCPLPVATQAVTQKSVAGTTRRHSTA